MTLRSIGDWHANTELVVSCATVSKRGEEVLGYFLYGGEQPSRKTGGKTTMAKLSKNIINAARKTLGHYDVATLTQGIAWVNGGWRSFRELSLIETLNTLHMCPKEKLIVVTYYWAQNSDRKGRTEDEQWIPAMGPAKITQEKEDVSVFLSGIARKGGRKRMAVKAMLREIYSR